MNKLKFVLYLLKIQKYIFLSQKIKYLLVIEGKKEL